LFLISVDTNEFDYSKVAFGTTVIAGSSAAAAAGASTLSGAYGHQSDSDMIVDNDENQFVIYAPAGKLGLVVDNPDDGAPVVHAIKEDSVLIGQIRVGDRLIGVDEVDVRTLSPVKVSKLISKRSSNPLRKLTLVRGKTDYDDETGTEGGETASHTVETSSQIDTDTAARSESVEPSGTQNNNQDDDHNDDETSNVGSMSRLSGDEDTVEVDEEEEESVLDYPDDTSSLVDAMSHASGGVAISTVDETKDDAIERTAAAATTTSTTPLTKVGEETGEKPITKSIDP
jgi:hypothetical protein